MSQGRLNMNGRPNFEGLMLCFQLDGEERASNKPCPVWLFNSEISPDMTLEELCEPSCSGYSLFFPYLQDYPLDIQSYLLRIWCLDGMFVGVQTSYQTSGGGGPWMSLEQPWYC